TIQTADVINGNAHVHGSIGVNDRDYFRFTVIDPGRLTASVTPSDGQSLLPRLALYGDAGQLLIQADDVGPANASAQLIQHLQPGTYYLAVSAVTESGNLTDNRSYVLDTALDPALPPFQAFPIGAPTHNVQCVAVGDFNNDGKLDLATGVGDLVSVL